LVRSLVGLIDELRTWNIVRSHAAIRASLHEIPRAGDPRRVAYHRFEDRGRTATGDSSLRHAEATLEGASRYELSAALCPLLYSAPSVAQRPACAARVLWLRRSSRHVVNGPAPERDRAR
jgi:hypothetical protein